MNNLYNFDITKHKWSGDNESGGVYGANLSEDNNIILWSDCSCESTITKADAIAIAKHFGLIKGSQSKLNDEIGIALSSGVALL
jgi:hypothetical protein